MLQCIKHDIKILDQFPKETGEREQTLNQESNRHKGAFSEL